MQLLQKYSDSNERFIATLFKRIVVRDWSDLSGNFAETPRYQKDPAVLKTLQVENHYGDSNSLPR